LPKPEIVESTDRILVLLLSFCHGNRQGMPVSLTGIAQFCQHGELAQSLSNNLAVNNEY